MSENGLTSAQHKMRDAGVAEQAITVFTHYYQALEAGATGLIPEETIEPRNCRGDLMRLTRRMNTSPVVPGLSMGNTFSFIADPYMLDNFLNIRYIEWRGIKWAATSVELQRPRILVTVGGGYNA